MISGSLWHVRSCITFYVFVIQESSCQYWPGSDKERFGEFNVVLLDEEEFPGHTIRKLILEVKEVQYNGY